MSSCGDRPPLVVCARPAGMVLSISKQPFPDFLLSADAMRLLPGEPLDEPYNAEAADHCGTAVLRCCGKPTRRRGSWHHGE
jgi:hypothetical protein